MKKMKNVQKSDVLEIIKNFPIKPRYNQVIITLNSLEEDGKVILSNNVLSDVQFVIAKGSMVNDIELGDQVIINVDKLMVPMELDHGNSVEKVMRVKLDLIEVGDNSYSFIDDRVIKAIDNRVEEIKL